LHILKVLNQQMFPHGALEQPTEIPQGMAALPQAEETADALSGLVVIAPLKPIPLMHHQFPLSP
jgi:hypothetical protein